MTDPGVPDGKISTPRQVSFTMKLPSSTRRVWIRATPQKRGQPRLEPGGAPGWYAVRMPFTTPPRDVFTEVADIDDAFATAATNIVLEGPARIPIFTGNRSDIDHAELECNDDRALCRARLRVQAADFAAAEKQAHEFLLPIISHLAFWADVPIAVSVFELVEEKTKARVLRFTLVAGVKKKITYTAEDGFHVQAISEDMQLLYAAYREALNAYNPFYRFLSFWKVCEGAEAHRNQRRRRLSRARTKADPDPDERVPDDPAADPRVMADDVRLISAYSGRSFSSVRNSLKSVLRNAVSHLAPRKKLLHPDKLEDVKRCEQAIPVIAYIARSLLEYESRAADALGQPTPRRNR